MEEFRATKCSNNNDAGLSNLGSFVHPPDGRLLNTSMKTVVGNKSIISTSFDPETLRCFGCLGHEDKKVWRSRGGQSGQRVVILLTDQLYPPALAVNGPGQCCKIIRRENGSLHQLAAELMDLARAKSLKAAA
jgi:hypothetical protein